MVPEEEIHPESGSARKVQQRQSRGRGGGRRGRGRGRRGQRGPIDENAEPRGVIDAAQPEPGEHGATAETVVVPASEAETARIEVSEPPQAPAEPAPVEDAEVVSETHDAEPSPAAEPAARPYPPSEEQRPQYRKPAVQHPQREYPRQPAITQAISQINDIIQALKDALDDLDEVLETLELAERQKTVDEHEIENLKRALRTLQRPREQSRGPR